MNQTGATQTETPLLNVRAAARRLGITPSTLDTWRSKGGGPKYIKLSTRCVRYRAEDLDAFVQERQARNTADAAIKAAQRIGAQR